MTDIRRKVIEACIAACETQDDGPWECVEAIKALDLDRIAPLPEPVARVTRDPLLGVSWTSIGEALLLPDGTSLYTVPPDQSERIKELEAANVGLAEEIQRLTSVDDPLAINYWRPRCLRAEQLVADIAAERDDETERAEKAEAELAEARKDVIEAAGALLIDTPEPGTDMARVMIANAMMRRERDAARAELAEARKDAELGRILMRYIDRMTDPTFADTQRKVVKELEMDVVKFLANEEIAESVLAQEQKPCPFGCETQEEHDAHYAKEQKP